MTSEKYRSRLNYEYNNKEFTLEEFDKHLMDFAMMYHKEQLRLCGVLKPLKDKEVLSFEDWKESYRDCKCNNVYYYKGNEYNLFEIKYIFIE